MHCLNSYKIMAEQYYHPLIYSATCIGLFLRERQNLFQKLYFLAIL